MMKTYLFNRNIVCNTFVTLYNTHIIDTIRAEINKLIYFSTHTSKNASVLQGFSAIDTAGKMKYNENENNRKTTLYKEEAICYR
jgi:hypothetical protein